MNQKKKAGAADYILVLLCALYCAAVRTVFSPCGPKEDGSFMHCHEAGRILGIMTLVMLVLALLRFFLPGRKARGFLSAGILVLAAVSAFVPGHLVRLCMMPEMRCRMLTQPGAMVMSVVTALSAAAAVISEHRGEKTERHGE